MNTRALVLTLASTVVCGCLTAYAQSAGSGLAGSTTQPDGAMPAGATSQPAGTRPAATRPGLATMAEIRQMVTDKAYADALGAISRALNSGQGTYDRIELQMMRAECYLQTHHVPDALDTLEAIGKQAANTGSKKDGEKAAAFWLLIKKSPGTKYTPQTGDDKTALDILPVETRKAAYEALLTDEVAAMDQANASATSTSTLTPIANMMEEIKKIKALEVFLTGKSAKCTKALEGISATVGRVGKSAEGKMNKEIMEISVSSHKTVTIKTGVSVQYGTAHDTTKDVVAGLNANETQTLNQIVSNTQKLMEFISFLRVTMDKPDELPTTNSHANTLKTRAEAVLRGDRDPGPTKGF